MRDDRYQLMQQWLTSLSPQSFTITPVCGDASHRRYFRAHYADNTTAIVMDAPPEKESCVPFVHICNGLQKQNVNTPKVLAYNFAQGLLLLSDFDDTTLLKAINSDNADTWYTHAFSQLLNIQQTKTIPHYTLPKFTTEFLLERCQTTEQWFFSTHLELTLTAAERTLLQTAYAEWIETALTQPQVFVHRDYHSRNLMALDVNAEHPIGVLDFQDAMLGPITYDVVSLLRDCYICWPTTQVEGWLQHYYERAQAAGLLTREISRAEFQRWFDWTGLKRHYRILGTFARLYHRDGKSAYLHDMPLILNYVLEVCQRYPAFGPLNDFFVERVLPVMLEKYELFKATEIYT